MSMTITETGSHAITEVERIYALLEGLFKGSPKGAALEERCRTTIEELLQIGSGRGLEVTPIAVLGSKNSGKSWLCRLLIKDENNKLRIPVGETTSTEKATWIGAQIPKGLSTKYETGIPVPAQAMVDLGCSYTVLDLPGFDDAGVEGREVALRAITGVPARVLVVSSQTMECVSQLEYLKQSDGTRILPLVVDSNFPDLRDSGAAELGKLKERIIQCCPDAIVEDPVVIPHTKQSSGREDELTRTAESILLPRLRALVSQPQVSPQAMENVRLEQFRRDVRGDLADFMSRVEPTYRRLVDKEFQAVEKLIERILGTDQQLRAAICMKMRLQQLSETPPWQFPFRTFQMICVITSGAWDRLVLTLAGSIPSLALLAFQVSRNFKNMLELRAETQNAIEKRLESMSRDELATENIIFTRSVNENLPPSCKRLEQDPSATRFKGLEEVTRQSAELFENTINTDRRRMIRFSWSGLLATLAFWVLIAGPLVAVYNEYRVAWWKAIRLGEYWQEFPVPSGSMLMASIMLSVLPVAVLALGSVAFLTPKSLIDSKMKKLREEHEKLGQRLSKAKTARLVSNDPAREAIRHLLDFLDWRSSPPTTLE